MGELTACIQEHHILHEHIGVKHQDMKNKWVLLTSSAGKALDTRSTMWHKVTDRLYPDKREMEK
jgi:hypothetical protein